MSLRIGVPFFSDDLIGIVQRLLHDHGDFQIDVAEYASSVYEYYGSHDSVGSIQFGLSEENVLSAPVLLVDSNVMNDCSFAGKHHWFDQETTQLIVAYTISLDKWNLYPPLANPHLFGLRCISLEMDEVALELVWLDSTTSKTIEEAEKLAKMAKVLHYTVVEYPSDGGFYERIRVPLELEALRLSRHLRIKPHLIDHLAKNAMQTDTGIFALLEMADPGYRRLIHSELARETNYDTRYTSSAGILPLDNKHTDFWKNLGSRKEESLDPMGAAIPKEGNVLIVGAPQLVDGWKKTLFEQSGGKVNAVTWPLWDLGEISEESVAPVLQQGPYRLIIECLVSAVEDRQSLLDALLPSLMPKGMVWVHTLNAAATVTVQVVPENTCAIGFGGLPPSDKIGSVELMCPASSRQHDLQRAAAMALHLGLTPFEVPDEPGGIGARALAILVNSTLFTVREGIVVTPTEADTAASFLFGMSESPLQIADQVGLDVIEAVLLGLKALLGEERYRVCPLITMRIESGATGHASGKGFYAK